MSKLLAIQILTLRILIIELYLTQAENVFSRAFRNLHKDPNPQGSIRARVETKWIEQKLDHFDEGENRTWRMRYMINDEFYQEGGPLFIHVGGEWTISPGYISSGHMYDMANESKAYLCYTEHRYYGKSWPVSDLSNENMKYLHVRQALADLAHFICTMKLTIPGMEKSKVILSGGSYSATMVTWFKKLYPDLATGCWASSAPLLAKVDFVEYKEITGQSIRLMGGDVCYNRIKNAIQQLERMLTENQTDELRSSLNICDTFDGNNELDVWVLFSTISDTFAGIVQNHQNNQIQNACKKIMDAEDDFKGFTNFMLNYFDDKNCSDATYKTVVDEITKTEFGNGMFRQWFYQTCNEYGWYQTSGSMQQPFGSKFPVKLFTTLCKDAYGNKFTPDYIEEQINKTNEFFGGLNPNVENVYMTHGQLDPWRGMGIQEEGKATIIPGLSWKYLTNASSSNRFLTERAHCRDFGSISDKDNDELKASKFKIWEFVKKWLLD